MASGKRFTNREGMEWDYSTLVANSESNIHSPVGASSASRWIACPGSNNLMATVPKQEPRDYASWGTVAHRLGEQSLIQLDFLNLSDEDVLFWIEGWQDTIIEQDGFELTIDQDMTDTAFLYVKTIKDILLKHDAPYDYLYLEKSFIMTDIDKEARGTTDAIIEIPYEVLYVIDLKAGKGIPVEVKDNVQLRYYGVGGLSLTSDEVKRIVTIIVQPRCFHTDGPVREWEYSLSELVGFAGALKKAIEKTRKKTAPLKSGDHCKWCTAKPICPEMTKQALAVASSEFKAIEEVTSLPDVSKMPVEKLIAMVEFSRIFKDCSDEAYSILHQMAEQGVAIPGHKLVPKKANRAWESVEEAAKELTKALGNAAYETPAPKLLTPATAEKAYKKAKIGVDLLPSITKPDNGTVLVPNDDMRVAVGPTIEAQFKAVEEEVTLDDL